MDDLPKRKQIRLPLETYCEDNVFSITLATYNRRPWFKIHPNLTDIGTDILMDLSAKQEASVYAWCFMPDHVHLLLQSKNCVDFIRFFKGRTVKEARIIDPARRLWQRSFYDHAMRSEEGLLNTAMYIWRNPVRQGLVEDEAGYKWSGSTVWPDWREFD